MAADGKRLRQEYERRYADQASFHEAWELLANYIMPYKSNITTKHSPGQKQTSRMFDSAGSHANKVNGASLSGAMMPAGMRWFSLTMRDREINKRSDVRIWLQDVRDIAIDSLSQLPSNFMSEALEILLDIGCFGTGGMLIEEAAAGYLGRFGGLRFRAMSVGEYVIGEDPLGRVDLLHRRFELEAGNLPRQFPTAVLPEKITGLIEQKPETMVPVLHCTYPRKDRAPSRQTGRNKPWASCYLLYDLPETILSEGGFEEFPYVVARWEKTSGEVWGRGPGFTALPDIRSLNRHMEIYLGVGGKSLDPPLQVEHDSIIGPLTLEPAGINYRERGAEKIEPILAHGNWQMAKELNDRLERKIDECFFVDAWRLRQQPNMTATEALILQEEMLRLVGPAAGRLYTEFLSPCIERVVAILARANQLPPPPEVLVQEGGEIDIQFEGPLARAQKSADLVAIDRVQNRRALVAQASGKLDTFDNFDLDEEDRHYALVAGYPANALRDPQVVAQIRQARQQAQAQADKMAAMERGAVAIGKAAPALELMQGGKEEAA